MKQPTFCGRELLPLSVIEAVRVGDPLAVESVLRYYDGYMNKLCTRTLYDLDGLPHVRVDEHMKDRLQAKLTEVIYQQKNYIVFILVMMKNKRLLTMQERQKEY